MNRFDTRTLFLTLFILLPIAIVVAIATGAVNIPLYDMFKATSHFLKGVIFSNDDFQYSVDGSRYLPADASQSLSAAYEAIVFQIRIPRVLLAAAIGCILALSGAAMQGLFRNPLADPSLIGVTAGASLGASLMIVLSAGSAGFWFGLPVLSLGAFLGGLVAVGLVYRLANSIHGTSVATMLLAGIGITALASGVTNLLEFYVDSDMLRNIRLWRMGALDSASYITMLVAMSMALIMSFLLPRYSTALNALLLGESEARHLGINTENLKKQLIVIVAAGVGISVALAGTIAFVGLIVPHILRLLIGPDHRYLLPASALGGAILLIVADNLSRTVMAPTELPVGLVTALVGVPFFISLLTRRHVHGLS